MARNDSVLWAGKISLKFKGIGSASNIYCTNGRAHSYFIIKKKTILGLLTLEIYLISSVKLRSRNHLQLNKFF